MNEEDLAAWFKLFDETKETFKWFWLEYFPPEYWNKLLDFREKENWNGMMGMMNDVWFLLPDGRFNIINNPSGWHEFLALIEV